MQYLPYVGAAAVGYAGQRAVGTQGAQPDVTPTQIPAAATPAAATPAPPAPGSAPMRGSPASYRLEEPANVDMPAHNYFMPYPWFGPGEVLSPAIPEPAMNAAVRTFSDPANEHAPRNRVVADTVPALIGGAARLLMNNPRGRMLGMAGAAISSLYVGSEIGAMHNSHDTPRRPRRTDLPVDPVEMAAVRDRTVAQYRADGQTPQATTVSQVPVSPESIAVMDNIATRRLPNPRHTRITPPAAASASSSAPPTASSSTPTGEL